MGERPREWCLPVRAYMFKSCVYNMSANFYISTYLHIYLYIYKIHKQANIYTYIYMLASYKQALAGVASADGQ